MNSSKEHPSTKRRRVDLDYVDPVIDLTEDDADVAAPHSVAWEVLVEKERCTGDIILCAMNTAFFREMQASRHMYPLVPAMNVSQQNAEFIDSFWRWRSEDAYLGRLCYLLEKARLAEFEALLAYFRFFAEWQWLVASQDLVHGYLFAASNISQPRMSGKAFWYQYPYAAGIFNANEDQRALCVSVKPYDRCIQQCCVTEDDEVELLRQCFSNKFLF